MKGWDNLEEHLEKSGYIRTAEGWTHRSRVRPVGAKVPQPDQGHQGEDSGVEGGAKAVGKPRRKRIPRLGGDFRGGTPEVVVTLIQCRYRGLDSHDNLRFSLKPLVDFIANSLQVDDADPRIRWEYRQEVVSRPSPQATYVRIDLPDRK